MRRGSRSRSPHHAAALSVEHREAILAEFAQLYWTPPDGPGVPPWTGQRAVRVMRFREQLVKYAELAACELDSGLGGVHHQLSKPTIGHWQRFTFFDDAARMSDVLFRGPIEPRHAADVDCRLHGAWRKFYISAVADAEECATVTADYRVSAVQVAMMLETARPPEACQHDGMFELPDARTLASLLLLRCAKDDVEELLEMYRLVCQKLQGAVCVWCNQPFDESSSAGLFEGSDVLVIPATVPKVLVPQCGHAIHTLCFGSQLLADSHSGLRGGCRRCGLSYAWTSIDIDPMINAFCLLVGSFVDKKVLEMQVAGEISRSTTLDIAEICQNFSLELCGLVSPASAWRLLTRRHTFTDPETVSIIGDVILGLLAPPEPQEVQAPSLPAAPAVIGPDDLSDDADSADARDEHLTEVFLGDVGAKVPPDAGAEPPLDELS